MSDPIEREAVIKEIQRFLGYIDQDMIDRIKIGLRKLPTIEAEPVKHGHWADDGLYADNHLFHVWRCSKCDKNMMVKDSSQEAGAPWLKYCPNCGAKMDGVDE